MYGFTGTIVGVRCKEGIALASDTRATHAYLVVSKSVPKIFKLDESIGAAISGGTGDIQSFINMLRVEANLYRLNRGRQIPTKGLVQIASNLLFGRRIYPYIVDGVLAGVDDGTPNLFFIDPVGGKIEEENFASAGSGSTIAYGVLENQYREGMTLDECTKLAAQSIKAAIERDAATGDKTVIAVIDKKGYRELSDEEVASLL